LGRALRAAIDLRPLVVSWAALRNRRFQELARVEGIDLMPLFRGRLLSGAAASPLMRHALIELSTEQAVKRLQPRVLVGCHELFLHSRALYAGFRAGAASGAIVASQHACYSPDKTFGRLDPGFEFNGVPDGQRVPAPDRLLVMGEADRRLWLRSGFRPEQIDVTGGLRYQHVRLDRRISWSPPNSPLRILVLGSLDTATEDLDVLEGVVLACDGVPNARVVLRNHPLEPQPLHRRPGFERLRSKVRVSLESAEEDLQKASLCITGTSSLAAEALVRAVPVWRWLLSAPDQTPLAELPVPSYHSVQQLHDALIEFGADPKSFAPSPELRQRVRAECFGPTDRTLGLVVSAVNEASRGARP
jgi:hypothetical protein